MLPLSSIHSPRLFLIGMTSQQKFNGAYGPAFLFHKVFGIESGEPFEMEMTTGYHTVQRVSCAGCKQEMGYLYVKAPNPEQEYKLGKYLVDTTLLSTILVQASTAQAFNAKL